LSSDVYLSLVVPAFNEQEVLPHLLQRVGGALGRLDKPFEVIIVDDGSTDATPAILNDAMRTHPWLRVLRLNRNCGQSSAFDAGFKVARGQIIATLDADLQNDPAEIVRLLPMLDGHDMVTGWRQKRRDNFLRRLQTRIANRIRNWISQETIKDSACSLKLYKRHCLDGIQLYTGMHRFMPTLVKMRGFDVLETPVSHAPRLAGVSKYSFGSRVWRAFCDLLAVRWMKRRYLRYQATEIGRQETSQKSEVGSQK
jgi:glycosyltransferase involved in cell wall biosynthesis